VKLKPIAVNEGTHTSRDNEEGKRVDKPARVLCNLAA
jgi:hypothetical protein